MPLWERYQQCLVTTDPTELVLIIDQFEYVMLAGAEPPVLDEGVGSSRDEPTAPYGAIPKRSEPPAPSGLPR